MSKLTLTLALTLVLVGCSKDSKMAACSESCAESCQSTCSAKTACTEKTVSAPQYQVEVVINETKPEGIHMLNAPRMIVTEGEAGAISVNSGDLTYNIETVVKRENGELFCQTTASMVRDGQELMMPVLISGVGDDASMRVDDLLIEVQVQPVSG